MLRRPRGLVLGLALGATVLATALSSALAPGARATRTAAAALSAGSAAAGTASVDVDAGSVQSSVSPLLIGNNVSWETGDQVADPWTDGRTATKVAGFLQSTEDIRLLRFPGGLMANCYDWSKGRGPQAQRGDQAGFNFGAAGCKDQHAASHLGTQEFMAAMAAAAPNAKPLITVNVCTVVPGHYCALGSTGTDLCPAPPSSCPGATTMGADWVQYLNGNSADPLMPWAQMRASDGHPAPYGVHYFELGNELFDDPALTPAVYVAVLRAYAAAMKAEDPSIAVGGVVDDSGKRAGWDDAVAHSGVVDFVVPHMYGPNYSDIATTLRPAAVERWQAWGFDVAGSGPAEISVDAVQQGGTGSAPMDLVVDGKPRTTVPLTPNHIVRGVVTVPSLPAGHHRLLVGYPPAPSGMAPLVITAAQVCTPACATAQATPIDVTLTAPDPDAVHPLLPPTSSTPLVMHVSAAGAGTLTLAAAGMTAPPCPSVTMSVDGVATTLSTAVDASSPCHDVLTPATLSTPVAAGAHTIALSSTGGEADVTGLSVIAGGTATPTDLSLNPQGGQGFSEDVNALPLTAFAARLARLRAYGIPTIVSEWNIDTSYSTLGFAQFESVGATLFDALVIQQFERAGVLAASLWSLDGGDGFRVFHCSTQAAHDDPGACAASGNTPTNAIPGWLFSILSGAIDPSLLAATVSSPQVTTPPLLDGDGRTVTPGGATYAQLQATVTRSASTAHALLVNTGGTPLQVTINLQGATVAGTAQLQTLSGTPSSIDGCRLTDLAVPVNCTPDAVKPIASDVPAAGAQTVVVSLPADAVGLMAVPIVDTPPTPVPTPVASPSPGPPPAPGGTSRSASGYWLVAGDGGIFPFGSAGGYGSTGGTRLNQPIVGMAATPSRHGYWLVASDGGIFPFGDAAGYGSTGAVRLNKPIVGMAATPSGHGYWLVASDGGIFPFGDAGGFGSTGGVRLNQPIVGMASTPSGLGYWLVASDGGMFPFGDAGGYGSTGAVRLNQPIVGMASTPSGLGYWLVASDGGIFPFGDAGGYGSTGAVRLNEPIVGMLATPSGLGYWLVASDGGIFPFGDAGGFGSTGGSPLVAPIVGMAAA